MVKVLVLVAGIVTEPKSVPSTVLGPESPSRMLFPNPCRFISGITPDPPVAAISKLNGFSSGSLVTKDIFAFLVPIAVGVNVIVNVVDPPGITVAEGGVVTTNSELFIPPILIVPILKSTVPEFCMVKVLDKLKPILAVPKFVKSVVIGVMSSSGILKPFPDTEISGKFTVATTAILGEEPHNPL